MALTKIGKEGITGVSNASNATFLTATSAEGVTLAGALAVTGVHTVGNNAVITSEGGAVTTNIAQGLAKQWIHLNGTGTIAIVDSFNTTSITDVGTGEYTVTIANDMANIGYSKTATGAQNNAVGAQIIKVDYGRNGNDYIAPTVTAYRVQNFLASNADAADTQYLNATAHGDLA